MESQVEICIICGGVDLNTVLMNADSFEPSCSRKQCPFARHFMEMKRFNINTVFDVRFIPRAALEGEDISIEWNYRGDTQKLEYVSNDLTSSFVNSSGRTTFKANRIHNSINFSLKFKGKPLISKSYSYIVYPLPNVKNIVCKKRVPRGSPTTIKASFENVYSATIFDKTGSRYDFTSGNFSLKSLTQDFNATIEVSGIYGGRKSYLISIKVFDPPKIKFFEPFKPSMSVGSVGIHLQTVHAESGRLTIRDKDGVAKSFKLDANDLVRKTFDGIDLKAGIWTAELKVYNQYGDGKTRSFNFSITDLIHVQIGKMLLNSLITIVLITCAGGFVYLCWPAFTYIWDVIVKIIGLALWVIEGLFNVVVYVFTHLWVWIVAGVIWFLYKIS
jgi:hypothetical protein